MGLPLLLLVEVAATISQGATAARAAVIGCGNRS